MAATKILGIVSLGLSIPFLLLGVIYLFGQPGTLPALVPGQPERSGHVAAALGGFLLLAGVVLMLVKPKARGQVVSAQQQAVPQQVEIKRSEMNWGSAARTRSRSEELQDQLEMLNQKLSRIKVQYGMGELSSESYKTLSQQYEQEKAAIERKIIEQQGH